jgi:hypothetical protein
MPNSARYRKLVKRLNELRSGFLPRVFSPTGSYSLKQFDRARGYRVLVHAEIEAFLEEIARNAVSTKASQWKNQQKISSVLFCVLAAYHRGFIDNIESPNIEPLPPAQAVKDSKTIQDVVEAATRQYMGRLVANNGIKEVNLKVIFIPLGIDFGQLDNTWVANMDSFGRARGDVAHQSTGVSHTIDPQSELATVISLLVGLKALDEKLNDLMN